MITDGPIERVKGFGEVLTEIVEDLAGDEPFPVSQVDGVGGDGSSASHDVPELGTVKLVPPVGAPS